MSTSYDAIVIGVGSMGSSACYHLAQRGYRVLGLEQFEVPHENGSHAGQSRIIRKAYFEDPNYVPLLNRAYENWKLLELQTGSQIYFPTGLVYFGPPDHPLIKGVNRSADLYRIPLERVTGADTRQRFPLFKIPGNFETLYEADAGFVTPEKAIRLYAELAVRTGAEIHTREKVITWNKEGNSVTVTTGNNIYRAGVLIITAGAWAGKMIANVSRNIRVTRQFVAWMKPRRERGFDLSGFPCWLLADESKPGCYYGFPMLPTEKFGEPSGLKVAHHHPAAETDPDHVNREVTADDASDLQYVLDKYFHTDFDSILSFKVCLYANSPDENFIIDKLPGFEENVIVACGFSGHGFKFASAVGEILADLAIDGATPLPIEFLNAKRFS